LARLVVGSTSRYKDIDIDTSDYSEGCIEKVSDELGARSETL